MGSFVSSRIYEGIKKIGTTYAGSDPSNYDWKNKIPRTEEMLEVGLTGVRDLDSWVDIGRPEFLILSLNLCPVSKMLYLPALLTTVFVVFV